MLTGLPLKAKFQARLNTNLHKCLAVLFCPEQGLESHRPSPVRWDYLPQE